MNYETALMLFEHTVKKTERVSDYHGHLHQNILSPTEKVKYMNVGWDVDYSLRCL